MPVGTGSEFCVIAAVAIVFLCAVAGVGLEGGLQGVAAGGTADQAGEKVYRRI